MIKREAGKNSELLYCEDVLWTGNWQNVTDYLESQDSLQEAMKIVISKVHPGKKLLKNYLWILLCGGQGFAPRTLTFITFWGCLCVGTKQGPEMSQASPSTSNPWARRQELYSRVKRKCTVIIMSHVTFRAYINPKTSMANGIRDKWNHRTWRDTWIQGHRTTRSSGGRSHVLLILGALTLSLVYCYTINKSVSIN